MNLIGRDAECRELKRLMHSGNPEFVAVYGRRRVGKTFLIKEFFNYTFTFYTSGLARSGFREQLYNFWKSLKQYGLPEEKECPATWFDAFDLLKEIVQKSKVSRKVIFIDELPWMDTQKSNFVSALDRFWNSWASEHSEIMLVVCGSAASWMVKNIIKNRGGLHNRITSKIKLSPFSLRETDALLKSNKIFWSPNVVAESYMILGGIPYYLSLLDKNRSLYQNLNDFFFKENAKLEGEFEELYSSLFRKSAEYVKIIELLAKKKSGHTRQELIDGLKCKDGGSLTRKLEELEHCGFIRKYKSLGMRCNTYQLTDFYSLFYISFLKNESKLDNCDWNQITVSRKYTTWTGLAFERLCFSQLDKIKEALGIRAVLTKTYPYYDGQMQLDMVIDRNDKSVSVCEMKWSDKPYSMTTSDKSKMISRVKELKTIFKGKSIFSVMVTSSGLVENDFTRDNVNDILTVESLF